MQKPKPQRGLRTINDGEGFGGRWQQHHGEWGGLFVLGGSGRMQFRQPLFGIVVRHATSRTTFAGWRWLSSATTSAQILEPRLSL